MRSIEIITEGKSDLELIYEMAQRYCAAEDINDGPLKIFYRDAGYLMADEITIKQIGEDEKSYLGYVCALFNMVALAVRIGKTIEEVKELLEKFGIK